MKLIYLLIASAMMLPSISFAQSDARRVISYQGMLELNGKAAIDGFYQMTITLYGKPDRSEAIWSDSYVAEVRNGIFNIMLGSDKPLPNIRTLDRQLWVGVKVNGEDELHQLASIGAVPLALNVANEAITKEKLAPDVMQMLAAGGTQNAQSDPNDWTITGNGTTSPPNNFLGTTDSVALELKVYSGDRTPNRGTKRVMRYEPDGLSPNIIGGYQGNSVSSGAFGVKLIGSTISGGGDSNAVNPIKK